MRRLLQWTPRRRFRRLAVYAGRCAPPSAIRPASLLAGVHYGSPRAYGEEAGPDGRPRGSVSPLRIAVLAPISWRVPPRHYGPWEQFASLLTEGLVARGADVTLFATADSVTSARLASVVSRGYSETPGVDAKVVECLHIASLFERADEFDLIHNSFDFLPLTYSGLVDTPVLTTIHGLSSPAILPVYRRYNATTSYVAISEADRHPSLDYLTTIHHGIDTDAFALHAAPGGYLLFFGRIHPDKGTAEAIEIAAGAGRPLVIAGIVQDQRYFDQQVAPHLDGKQVSFIGAATAELRSEILGGAEALLHPIRFDEPFGYSVVEAMACGTPVIAFRRGSMIELIDDAYPRRALRTRHAFRRLAAGVAPAFQRLQQAVFERRIGVLEEAGDDASHCLRTGEAVAIGGVVGAYRVAGPLAASRAGMRHDVVLAVDDAELAIVEIRVASLERPHDVLRRVALRQHVERERIDVTQVEGLRFADADAGTHAFVASPAGYGKRGRADAEAAGARTARDDGIGHGVSFAC